MNKPSLSFVYFSALALAVAATHSVAAPNDPASSTEASDRQFLANLENSEPPKAPPTQPAPAVRPETAPAAIAKTNTDEPARSKAKPVQAKVATKKTTEVAKANYRDRISQPAAAADIEEAPVTPTKKTTTTVTVVQQPLNDGRDGDHDNDRDHDHDGEHHHFFHRLFAHVFNQQHPEDW
ncbi:MAG: hypothetical protein WDN28_14700 [Chthoniobacter sp.]